MSIVNSQVLTESIKPKEGQDQEDLQPLDTTNSELNNTKLEEEIAKMRDENVKLINQRQEEVIQREIDTGMIKELNKELELEFSRLKNEIVTDYDDQIET